MLIEAFIYCWNEEKILPFTLEYYSQFCDKITLMDNHSTDNSVEIAKGFPKVSVKPWGENNGIHEERVITIARNTCYKEFGIGADWVIVADADEFLYHPDIRTKLNSYMHRGVTLPKPPGYDMISENFPKDGVCLTKQITTGVPQEGMSKSLVFDPRINLIYETGAHRSKTPVGSFSESVEFKVLHYKNLSLSYKMDRIKALSSRRSEYDKEFGHNMHWSVSDEEIKAGFQQELAASIAVIE